MNVQKINWVVKRSQTNEQGKKRCSLQTPTPPSEAALHSL
jgi:hypothetical protein